MQVINSDDIQPFDCDDTLVMHMPLKDIPKEDLVAVIDPIQPLGPKVGLRINRPMVRLLQEAAQRGSFVVVWSRGGVEWAANVVKALDLEPYVDLCLSKPRVYFDDKPVSEWLTDRVYLGPDTVYKQKL